MSSHNDPATADRLLTVDELAAYLGLTRPALRQMIHRRQIPFIRLGERRIRFDLTDIDAWLAEQRVEAVG
jgi:excisionase family DNA binding protein